jgi:hypothetical protein
VRACTQTGILIYIGCKRDANENLTKNKKHPIIILV